MNEVGVWLLFVLIHTIIEHYIVTCSDMTELYRTTGVVIFNFFIIYNTAVGLYILKLTELNQYDSHDLGHEMHPILLHTTHEYYYLIM